MHSPVIEVLDELEGDDAMRVINLAARLADERMNVPGQLRSYETLNVVEKVGVSSWRLTAKGRAHAERMYASMGLTREQWLSMKTAMS